MNLIPDRHYKSVFDIDFEALYKQGVRGLLFDIDNTLVKDEASVDGDSIKLFSKLNEMGFMCCLVSNNDLNRVKPFANSCAVSYVYKVLKPKKEGFVKAIEIIGTNIDNTIMIGDQLITDILGAHNADIKAFLVDPIDRDSERFHIKLKRLVEYVIIIFNKKKFKYYPSSS